MKTKSENTGERSSPSILIVAGEASSSLYAQRLLEHWKNKKLKIHAFGVGSRAMESCGFECLGRSEDMAVVGLTEVIKHYSHIKSVFLKIIEQTELRRPDVILLLDYPDFNLRLAEKLKPLGIPIVYYISPQVWAWRKSRIHKIRKLVDRMLCVLPFEEEFYKQNGVQVDFVGHPLLDEISKTGESEEDKRHSRGRFGFSKNDVVVGLMPGSRQSEIRHNLAEQLKAVRLLHERQPQLKFALLVAPSLNKEDLRPYFTHLDIPIQMIQDDPLVMVGLVDYVICASGTATLVVGLMEKPMVIMYKVNALTALLARYLVRNTIGFGLVNLVLGKKVVPELFQEQASAENMATEIEKYIADRNYDRDIRSTLGSLKNLLGKNGTTQRVSEILEPFLFKGP